jgi:acetyl-CoA carboxylase carboxyltransferase component
MAHVSIRAPMQGTIVRIDVSAGDVLPQGAPVLVMESMKMEHVITTQVSGAIRDIVVSPEQTVEKGDVLVRLEPQQVAVEQEQAASQVDLDALRPDLEEAMRRRETTTDAARPTAVERQRAKAHRTARENIADLCDDGSFVEYGGLAIAAQRRRRTVEDLIERTPGDGLVAGVGRVNGDLFGDDRSRCVVMAYDYTVLAGTQGFQNHRKKDRMFELAEKHMLPVVFFTEGGGGRPGDTDAPGVAGLDVMAFHLWGRLSGLVPRIGVNAGYCFAGNAAILGCSDVVIATKDSSIGMGGPAMIEGGGLGVVEPKDVGPMDVQIPNGVVDIAVEDEAEAVAAAKKYLSYFQGPVEDWTCADQRILRTLIPENRLRIYDVRTVIDTMCDDGSVLELRPGWGPGMITALARIEGRPVGVVANNPAHLAGAIDADGGDKAARFMQLCDAFDVPLLFLCDTPGIMVGPEAEKTALVRHVSRMFVTGASLTVPFFTIILRKGYGLGAQAMAGGSFKAPVFCVAWPTGEFGGMGLEGAVKLGFRKELEAIEDEAERERVFQEMVARSYEHGKALNMASHFEIDDVIDPVESRTRIVEALRAMPPAPPRTGKKRPAVDTW